MVSHEEKEKRLTLDFSTVALWPRKQWASATKSDNHKSVTKLPIKCEGGLAHCSKTFFWFSNTKHFSGHHWRGCFTKLERKPTQDIGVSKQRPNTGKSRGSPGPQDHSGQSSENSQAPSEQAPWNGVNREGRWALSGCVYTNCKDSPFTQV